jgi:SH3-like domain-containing protein
VIVLNSLQKSPRACFFARSRALSFALIFATLGAPFSLTGCNYFRQKAAERYVYVTARQVFLRDRVAAVSNRTGTALNGEKLVVLDHTKRAIKVRTPRGEVGWVEEKLTADQKTADQFSALHDSHANDPIVATATARDEVYLHSSPGRETERFYRLAEGDSLSLLARATVSKTPPATPTPSTGKPGGKSNSKSAPAAPAPVAPVAKPAEVPAKVTDEDAASLPAAVVPPPVMEDWWLVRNTKGETGWIYSRMIEVTAPDALARYSEGQRIVGAYILTTVDDPDSGILDNGNPVTRIPEYVTLLSPYKAGLPYDFDQVRVFIWNVKKHRYETGFRETHIVGYLPIVIGTMKDKNGKGALAEAALPSFTYKVLPADVDIPTPDPVTGLVKPAQLIDKTYRLEGNLCRRILPPNTSAPQEAHPVVDDPKGKTGKGKKKHKG